MTRSIAPYIAYMSKDDANCKTLWGSNAEGRLAQWRISNATSIAKETQIATNSIVNSTLNHEPSTLILESDSSIFCTDFAKNHTIFRTLRR